MTDINTAKANADKAQAAAAADKAHADLADAATAKIAAWQNWADNYNPDADRQAVIDAEAALAEAITTSPLGAALVAYLEAIKTERAHKDTATTARSVGATLTEDQAQQINNRNYLGADGHNINSRGYTLDYIGRLIPEYVHNITTSRVDAATDATKQSIAAATANAPKPTAYKITQTGGWHGNQDIGSTRIRFIRGVAFIPAGHALLNWYRKKPDAYTVEPVLGVPDDWANTNSIMDVPTTTTGADSNEIEVRKATHADVRRMSV